MNNLINAEPVEVELLTGQKETISLKRLSIRELYTFAEHVRANRTPELVALCVGKPGEWVDSISDKSFAALTSKCVAINFQRAMTLGENDPVMATLIGPVVAAGVLSVAQMTQATLPRDGATTSDSLPAPASSESAAATGSASST